MAAAHDSSDPPTPDDPLQVVLRLRLDPDGLPVGSLSADGHEPVPVEGWLGLMAELRHALEPDG